MMPYLLLALSQALKMSESVISNVPYLLWALWHVGIHHCRADRADRADREATGPTGPTGPTAADRGARGEKVTIA